MIKTIQYLKLLYYMNQSASQHNSAILKSNSIMADPSSQPTEWLHLIGTSPIMGDRSVGLYDRYTCSHRTLPTPNERNSPDPGVSSSTIASVNLATACNILILCKEHHT